MNSRYTNTIMNSFWTILFLGISLTVTAQELLLELEVEASQVSVDPFNNIYVLTADREYRKYDSKGNLVHRYNDLELNVNSGLSSDHAFKSVVYYPNFELIRVFGNRLQVLAELDLKNYNIGEVTAIGPTTGYQTFWIFDGTAQELVQIDQQNDVVNQSGDLTNLLDEPIFPTLIKERSGWLYVYDPERGLFIFDAFGTFDRRLDIPGALSFSVFNGRIFYYSDKGLFELDRFSNASKRLEFKPAGKLVHMAFRKMVVQEGNTLRIWQF